MTFEEFEQEYVPLVNHIAEDSLFDGYMFETYDEEWEFVKAQNPNNVWTIIDGDFEQMFIVPGFHVVNRIGYIITEEEWEDQDFEVDLNEKLSASAPKVICTVLDFLESINIELTEQQDCDLRNKILELI